MAAPHRPATRGHGGAVSPVRERRLRPRPVRSEQDLKQMAKRHLTHEIRMLREMTRALQGGTPSPKALRNALVETFLIHYRNLHDFFYPDFPRRKKLKDDVYASDFVGDPQQWRKHRPAWLPKHAEQRKRMNTQLAHLSYKRLRYETRSWPDAKMYARMEQAVQDFLEALPKERRRWLKTIQQEGPVLEVKPEHLAPSHDEETAAVAGQGAAFVTSPEASQVLARALPANPGQQRNSPAPPQPGRDGGAAPARGASGTAPDRGSVRRRRSRRRVA